MGTSALPVVFLLILICSAADGREVKSCDKISIQCDPSHYQIVINDTTATSDLFLNILEQCNAHHECHVDNPDQECVNISYWCRMNFPMLEIKKSSAAELRSEIPLLGFISEDYLQGKYQDAQNIDCNVTIKSDENDKRIHWIVHEFAPFATTSPICLHVKNSQLPKFCSGSGKVDTQYGPFSIADGYQLSIKLENPSSDMPKVRFWIDVKVSPDKLAMYQLNCHSYSVTEPKNADAMKKMTKVPENPSGHMSTAMIITISSSVVGAFFLITVFTLVLVAVLWCRQSKFPQLDKNEKSGDQDVGTKDENQYTYIDLDSIESKERIRGHKSAQDVPRDTVEARKENKKMESDVPASRELQGSQNDSNVLQEVHVLPALPPRYKGGEDSEETDGYLAPCGIGRATESDVMESCSPQGHHDDLQATEDQKCQEVMNAEIPADIQVPAETVPAEENPSIFNEGAPLTTQEASEDVTSLGDNTENASQ